MSITDIFSDDFSCDSDDMSEFSDFTDDSYVSYSSEFTSSDSDEDLYIEDDSSGTIKNVEPEVEEELSLGRIYRSTRACIHSSGTFCEVETFSQWTILKDPYVYNLKLSCIRERYMDMDNIHTVTLSDKGMDIKLVSKNLKHIPDTPRSQILVDYIRDVMYHAIFDSSSLIPPLLSAETNNIARRVMLSMGGDLTHYLTGKEFNTLQFKHVAFQLLKYVELMTQCQFVHQDFKPTNILITLDDKKIPRISICDFGFSRTLKYNDSVDFTGTVLSAPPESLNNKKLSMKSVLFSLGVTFLACLNKLTPIEYMIQWRHINIKKLDSYEIKKTIYSLYQSFLCPIKNKFWNRSVLLFPSDSSPEDQNVMTSLIKNTLVLEADNRTDIFTLVNNPWFNDIRDYYSYLDKEAVIIQKKINKWYSWIDDFSWENVTQSTRIKVENSLKEYLLKNNDIKMFEKFIRPNLALWWSKCSEETGTDLNIIYAMIDNTKVDSPKYITFYLKRIIKFLGIFQEFISI